MRIESGDLVAKSSVFHYSIVSLFDWPIQFTPSRHPLRYALSDGQRREETIRLDRTTADAAASLRVTGSYRFKDAATGRRYIVRYTADAAGFRAHVLDLPENTRKIVLPPRPQDSSELCSALRNSLCG